MQVTAMDFSTPNAIAHLQADAAARKLDGNIRALVQDVTEEQWPVAPATMDFIVDAFLLQANITPYESRLSPTRREICFAPCVRAGILLVSFASSIGESVITGNTPSRRTSRTARKNIWLPTLSTGSSPPFSAGRAL